MQGQICATMLVLVALASACVGRPAREPEPVPQPPAPLMQDLEALYRARMDSARARATEADVRFVTAMIVHHAQALLMSELALERDAGPGVRTLAARIKSAQKDEIAFMRRWLVERGRSAPEVHISGTAMTVHGAGDEIHAHGMLTDAELRGLIASQAADFDRLFLLFMIRHHQGAIAMVRDLTATPGAARDPPLARLAAEIEASQTIEITVMRRMLAERSPGDRP